MKARIISISGFCVMFTFFIMIFPICANGAQITGEYISSRDFPVVFLRKNDIYKVAQKINLKEAFPKKMFDALEAAVSNDIKSNVDWKAYYSGCDLYIYLRMFSIEAGGGYKQETRSDEELRQSASVEESKSPPRGAALVAARLALYAALLHAGVQRPTKAPSEAVAEKLARKILLTWSENGFRININNKWERREFTEQFCRKGKKDSVVETTLGLQIARGVLYSVYAEDMLRFISSDDNFFYSSVDKFHEDMSHIILNSNIFDFSGKSAWKKDCEKYSNQLAMQLAALLAIFRENDEEHSFNNIVGNGMSSNKTYIDWIHLFNRIIYGEHDQPNECYKNDMDPVTHTEKSFSSGIVFPGEIDDRYRNSNPHQTFGYALGSLRALYYAADILKNAGYEPYDYNGVKGQSIETATLFYACYVESAGLRGLVTFENSHHCENIEQYKNKYVEGAEVPMLFGSYVFSKVRKLNKIANIVKQEDGKKILDPLLFGFWP